MKAFFITTAILEVGAGLALVCVPQQAVSLLLGPAVISVIGAGAVPIEQIAGCALIALALANWQARDSGLSAAGRGVVSAMTVYNLGAVIVLGEFGLNSQAHGQSVGLLLWPAVILHTFMTAWCAYCLLKKQG